MVEPSKKKKRERKKKIKEKGFTMSCKLLNFPSPNKIKVLFLHIDIFSKLFNTMFCTVFHMFRSSVDEHATYCYIGRVLG